MVMRINLALTSHRLGSPNSSVNDFYVGTTASGQERFEVISNTSKQLYANGNGFFIIGMHRSGTSVLAGALSTLGYSTGTGKLIGASDFNPKGYFEMESLVIQNQDWLTEQEVLWGPGIGDFNESFAYLNSNGTETLRSIEVPQPWMMKDPRLCLTLPAWDSYFEKPPPAVFTYRHPLTVALSLCQRSKTELFYGLRSWVYHNMHAIKNFPKDRCVVRTSHQALMQHPVQETLRISDEMTLRCGLAEAPSRSDAHAPSRIEQFVSKSLHHNQEVIEKGVDMDRLRVMFKHCSFPRTKNNHRGNRNMYNLAMSVYADIESGRAFEEGYVWPNLPYMNGEILAYKMKVWNGTLS